MSGEAVAPELLARAKRTAAVCAALSFELSCRAEKGVQLERVFVGVSNVVGVTSLIATFFLPPISFGGTDADRLLTALSALVLIVVPYIQMAAFRHPPSRFQDFSFYIGGYAHKISEILSDAKSQRRYERLMEVLALADKNLNDVSVKWPRLMAEANSKQEPK